MMKAKFLVPLVIFFVLAGFLGYGLTLNPREVPSPLIDKPAPGFTLARLDQPETTFSLEDMKGKVFLLNVWASWCVSCRQEHPYLVELKRQGIVPVVGLNYKDERDEALQILNREGASAQHPRGVVGDVAGTLRRRHLHHRRDHCRQPESRHRRQDARGPERPACRLHLHLQGRRTDCRAEL